MRIVSSHLLDTLTTRAKKSPRKRYHLKLHEYSDPVLKLIMAMEPDTYAQPNKHTGDGCSELFIALRGKFLVVFFTESGSISEHVTIGPDEENIMVEVPEATWHTMLSLREGSIAMEVIKGPYDKKTYKDFASWAPAEGDPSSDSYMEEIKRKLGVLA